MANQQGFSAQEGAAALVKLFKHYDRTKIKGKDGEYYQPYPNLTVRGKSKRSQTYSEIDPSRTHLNYNLAATDQPKPQREFFKQRLSEVRCHKSALKNALVDWVVTLPDMPEVYEGREEEFFKAVYEELRDRYGRENVVSAYVHMDESQPHMHFAFIPIVEDEKRSGEFKLSRKAVNMCERTAKDRKTGREVVKRDTREFSKQFHEWLEGRVCERMGFEHAGIVLTDEQRKKRQIKENLDGPEELRAAQEEVERLRAELGDARRDLGAARAELEGVRDQLADAEFDRDVARDEVRLARQKKAEIGRDIDRFRKRYEEIVGEIAKIAEALSVRRFLDRFRDKLVEFASSRICRDALDAGGAFASRRDGRRAEKVLEDGARERMGELKALGDEMRAWSPFDEIGELRAASKGNAWAKARGIQPNDMPIGDGERENRS